MRIPPSHPPPQTHLQYRTLGRTGEELSILGFGGAPLGDEYGATSLEEGAAALHAALDAGVNLIDVAPYYGRNLAEERLGAALEGRRKEAFLATKCARYDRRGFDFSAERVRTSIDESLARLRTDYLDLYQVHDVEFGDETLIREETLPALLEVRASGKARFVGITGLPVHMLASLARDADVDTVLSYCHGNLLCNDLVEVVGPVAEAKNLGLINASPLHMGILSDSGPQDWHPAGDEVKAAGRDVARLCEEAGTRVSVVALRYGLNLPGVTSTLCGMRTPAEVEMNLAALEGETDPALLAAIHERIAPVLNQTWHEGLPENAPPGH